MEEYLDLALEMDPDNSMILTLSALFFERKREFERAEGFFF